MTVSAPPPHPVSIAPHIVVAEPHVVIAEPHVSAPVPHESLATASESPQPFTHPANPFYWTLFVRHTTQPQPSADSADDLPIVGAVGIGLVIALVIAAIVVIARSE